MSSFSYGESYSLTDANTRNDKSMFSIGIDGCKTGWIAVKVSHDGFEIGMHHDIADICDTYKDCGSFLIDMPIGLQEDLEDVRPDSAIRKVLHGRASCVFNTPCRQAVYSDTYDKAGLVNKSILGVGLSRQSFAICPKIREIDEFLDKHPTYINTIKESHPEICFTIMNSGKPIRESKHSPEGQNIRIDLLQKYYQHTKEFIGYINTQPRLRRMVEDCIDALCLAVTGMMGLMNGFKTIPSVPIADKKGVLMQIIYADMKDSIEGFIDKGSVRKKYNKLIRDKIPEIIETSGKVAVIEKLGNASYKKRLDEKLGEELQEYLSNGNTEELADLIEVIYAILKYKGISITDFELLRKKKAEERGSFDKRLFLKEVIEE